MGVIQKMAGGGLASGKRISWYVVLFAICLAWTPTTASAAVPNLTALAIRFFPDHPVEGREITIEFVWGNTGGTDIFNQPFAVDIYINPSFDTSKPPPKALPGNRSIVYVYDNSEGPPPTPKITRYKIVATCGKLVVVGIVNRLTSQAETDYSDNWIKATRDVRCQRNAFQRPAITRRPIPVPRLKGPNHNLPGAP